jgi:hypothetical protein
MYQDACAITAHSGKFEAIHFLASGAPAAAEAQHEAVAHALTSNSNLRPVGLLNS